MGIDMYLVYKVLVRLAHFLGFFVDTLKKKTTTTNAKRENWTTHFRAVLKRSYDIAITLAI